MSVGLIYRNICIYRLMMNVIYLCGYRRRFRDIMNALPEGTRSVTELCFGDTIIAKACQQRGIKWTGYDINKNFVRRAKKKNSPAYTSDIMIQNIFNTADVFIIAGSLYHFHDKIEELFEKIFNHTKFVVISEPVKNISNPGNIIGRMAARMSNAGKGKVDFRYNDKTITELFESLRARYKVNYRVLKTNRDILAVIGK